MVESAAKLKRTLFASSITIILTVLLFFNSTLAWYTDSEAVINTFTFGEIDMKVWKVTQSEDVELSGTENEIVTVAMNQLMVTDYYFEPGVVLAMPPLYVENTGNIPFDYKMKISVSRGSYSVNLWDAIETYVYMTDDPATAPQTREQFLAAKPSMIKIEDLSNYEWSLNETKKSQKYVIYLYMREEAGNEYNMPNGIVGGTFTVTFIGYQQNMDQNDVEELYKKLR